MKIAVVLLVFFSACGPFRPAPYSGPEEFFAECLNPEGAESDAVDFELARTLGGDQIFPWADGVPVNISEGFQGGHHIDFAIFVDGPEFEPDGFNADFFRIKQGSSGDMTMIYEAFLTQDGEEVAKGWDLFSSIYQRVDEENPRYAVETRLVLDDPNLDGSARLRVEIDMCESTAHHRLSGEMELR